jgi:hypothetical protein
MHRRLLILSSLIPIGFALAMIMIIMALTSSNVFGFYHNMPMMIISSINNNGQIWPMGSMIKESDSINMLSSMMMNQEAKDVIIKVKTSQIVPAEKESEIALLVLDKETQNPLTGAQVLVRIERGASMTTMEMISSMLEAEEDKGKSSGIYKIRFTPDSDGYYTIHTHVIPSGNSMHSMMDNHLDIGIIAE